MKKEDAPFGRTAELIGAELEDESQEPSTAERAAEEPESYRDIGERRLDAVSERVSNFGKKTGGFMSRAWEKIKSFGSASKSAAEGAVYYTLAAPEMIADAGTAAVEKTAEAGRYVGEKAVQGAEFVGEKVVEGATYAGDKVVEGAQFVGEKAVDAAVFASETAKDAYEGVVNWGEQKYEGLRSGAGIAKEKFVLAFEGAKQRRAERKREQFQMKTEKFNEKYERAKEALAIARARLEELQRERLGMSSEVGRDTEQQAA